MLQRWRETGAFEQLRELRAGAPEFRFLDGPITANNPMGVHHAWGRTLKDAVIRFHAMCGQSCRYQNGFDCQGLWVEVEVERALGFRGKPDIEAFGIDEFSRACRERVDEYAQVISEQSARLGQWMDWDNSLLHLHRRQHRSDLAVPPALLERGYLYEGHVPLPWCTRCGTSLSQHEMLGSYVESRGPLALRARRRPARRQRARALVLWTTTPWTLPANVAAAVHPTLTVRRGRLRRAPPRLIDAASRARLGMLRRAVGATLEGSELIGLTFETFFPASRCRRSSIA